MKRPKIRKAHQEIVHQGTRYRVTMDATTLSIRQHQDRRIYQLSLADLVETATGQLHLNTVPTHPPSFCIQKGVPPPSELQETTLPSPQL